MNVAHESTTPDEAARLLAVAEAVQRVRPPGIVRIVEIAERRDGTVVVITDEPEPVDDAPAMFAAAASALAGLHAQGIAHGAVTEAARRRDPAGRAVLPLPLWRADDATATVEGDIAAMCELAGERTARSAHELATRLAAPSPRVLERNRKREARPERTHGRGAIVGALAGAAGVVTMGVAVLAPSSTARPTLSTVGTPTTVPRSAMTTAVSLTVPASTERVVALAGHRYELGIDGDLVVLGTWSCGDDGPLLPVVVRPRTGDVLVFEHIGPDAAATPVTRVDGITGAGRSTDDAGCDHLLLDTAGEGAVVVDIARDRGGGSPPRSPAAAPAP